VIAVTASAPGGIKDESVKEGVMLTATAKTRIQFSNILFATDFSPAAARAIPYVKAIAQHYDAQVVALHVNAPMVNPATQPESWCAALEAESAQRQEQRQELLAEFAGTPCKSMVEEGDILLNVYSAIEKNHVDLTVIGTHGRTGLGKLVLGSIAEEIFRLVPCPVLTVGPQAGRAHGTEIREILLATDLSPESKAAAAYAASLAQEFQARLVLLHVVEDMAVGDLVTAADVTASSEKLLRNLLPPDAELWCKPEYVVTEGDAATRILEISKQRQSDLIVLGIKPETGVPGASTHLPIATAHKVVCQAACPVLTIRH
jgi:nucleotide-binding universal stress UspA family protein